MGCREERPEAEAEARVRTQVRTGHPPHFPSLRPPLKCPASPSAPTPPANLLPPEPFASCNYTYFSLSLIITCLLADSLPHARICLSTPGVQVLQTPSPLCTGLPWWPEQIATPWVV